MAKLQYFFIGYKNATDCINNVLLRWNKIDLQSTSIDKYPLHSFLFNSVKPKLEKINKRNTYSLWEDVHTHNPSVCGVYISYWELFERARTGNNAFTIHFPVQFNFDDIISLQAFDEYPNYLFGPLELVIRVTPDSLVWCCVDPTFSVNQLKSSYISNSVNENTKQYTTGNDINTTLSKVAPEIRPLNIQNIYDKCFIQVGSPGRACTNVVFGMSSNTTLTNGVIYANYLSQDLIIKADQISVEQAWSNITGYGVKNEAKATIAAFYARNPCVIPAEKITLFNFTQPPTPN
jgi:hypothetical protein